jgi:hypothetical protein
MGLGCTSMGREIFIRAEKSGFHWTRKRFSSLGGVVAYCIRLPMTIRATTYCFERFLNLSKSVRIDATLMVEGRQRK